MVEKLKELRNITTDIPYANLDFLTADSVKVRNVHLPIKCSAMIGRVTVTMTRSRKPAKGQIICQRIDYLSFYRFINLLKDRLKL